MFYTFDLYVFTEHGTFAIRTDLFQFIIIEWFSDGESYLTCGN